MGGAPLDWAKEGSRFRVQGSGFKVQGSRFKVQGCGGGFAANIYGAMPEGLLIAGIPVSSAFPSRGRCPEGADRALAV